MAPESEVTIGRRTFVMKLHRSLLILVSVTHMKNLSFSKSYHITRFGRLSREIMGFGGGGMQV